MKVLDLFSGIGGFSLGLERAGMTTVAFCEIEKYPQAVLRKHWPGVPIYEDVRTLTAERLRADGIETIDVITGGFPCQDVSFAGNQKGLTSETRSGLWSEIVRLSSELRPKYIIVENVTALVIGAGGKWFSRVLGDLATIGYDAEWHCIRAFRVGLDQSRDRVWILSYPAGKYGEKGSLLVESLQRGTSPQFRRFPSAQNGFEKIRDWERDCQPRMVRKPNGVSAEMDRLKCCGNAVVPQIPEIIGRAIMAIELSSICDPQ
jgi:DNA (cytosine-5)-methyltransferase 1